MSELHFPSELAVLSLMRDNADVHATHTIFSKFKFII